ELNTIFTNCGHSTYCDICAVNLKNNPCPSCRKYGTIIKIFKQGFDITETENKIKKLTNEQNEISEKAIQTQIQLLNLLEEKNKVENETKEMLTKIEM